MSFEVNYEDAFKIKYKEETRNHIEGELRPEEEVKDDFEESKNPGPQQSKSKDKSVS